LGRLVRFLDHEKKRTVLTDQTARRINVDTITIRKIDPNIKLLLRIGQQKRTKRTYKT